MFFYKAFTYLLVFSIYIAAWPVEAKGEVFSPFSPANHKFEEENAPVFKCQQPPKAIKDLLFESIYEEDDPSRSRVDEYRFSIYQEKSAGLSDFENKVSKMASLYLMGGASAPKASECAARWLYAWAKGGALLGDVNKGGAAIRKWSLASVSSSYAHIMKSPFVDKKHKARIEKWLRDVGRQVIEDYTSNPEWSSRKNNHLYWAAWSIAVTSYVLQDRKMFNWAIGKARIGIAQIDKDGVLPLELKREKRALMYHVFAVAPLVMIAEMGKRNGVDLYKDGALHRLVSRTLSGLENPDWFERKTRVTQDYREIYDSNGLAWLNAYNYRFSSRQAERFLSRVDHPMFNRRLGGDTDLLFPPN